MTDLAVIATLLAAAAGGALTGRAAVAVDARASGVTSALERSKLVAGAAGVALVALALVDAHRGIGFVGAVVLAIAASAAGFLRGAVSIVVAEELRERTTQLLTVRGRATSRRRPAA